MKREGKLVILVFLLAVGPAVLLSLFAVRVLQNWQVVLQKRLENEAARVLEQAVSVWDGQFRTSNIEHSTSNVQHNGPKAPDGSPFDVGSSMLNVRSSFFPWVDGVFVFRPGDGLVYPPADPVASSFVPPAIVPESARKAATLLQQATTLRAAGKTNEAAKVLREVAGTGREQGAGGSGQGAVGREQGAGGSGQGAVGREQEARDSDEGFYYDLIALKLLGDVEEARRRVLDRYDVLVPLQRDLMVEFIEQWAGSREQGAVGSRQWAVGRGQENSKSEGQLPTAPCPLPTDFSWRERMRGRALSAADRAGLAAEIAGLVAAVPEKGWIRARVGGREALVGREQPPTLVSSGAPRGSGFRGQGAEGREQATVWSQESTTNGIVALQFTEGNLIDHLNGLFATVASNSEIRVVASGQGAGGRGQGAGSREQEAGGREQEAGFREQGAGGREQEAGGREQAELPTASRLLPTASCFLPPVLGSQRLPSPLESIVLEAVPADPQAFLANARLQSRLVGVGGGLLLVSVVAGVWLIWRQAAGEIREARARTDFAAAVSHDLRTPLASMRMLAESLYLGNVTDPAKTRTFLGAILKESDRLSRLTDRALYFIRYGQGARRYEFNGNDLGSLVKDVVHTFAVGAGMEIQEKTLPRRHGEGEEGEKEGEQAGEENALRSFQMAGTPFEKIATHRPGGGGDETGFRPTSSDLPQGTGCGNYGSGTPDAEFPQHSLPPSSGSPLSLAPLRASVVNSSSPLVCLAVEGELPRVRFDDGAMEQVVYNLLDNAVKYSDKEKGVVIGVSVGSHRRRGGSEVVLEVSDQGLGMAPDEVRRVLKPYARGRGGAKQNTKGVGLGLALCHHVVQAHGGRIAIRSEPGKGTTFSIILPAEG